MRTGKSTIYGIDKIFCANGLSDDEEDEAAELMRELEKIKRERMEQKEKEASLLKYWLESTCLHLLTLTRNANGQKRNRSNASMILPEAILSSTLKTSV